MQEKRSLLIANKHLNYTLRTHARARRVSITVEPGGEVLVTIPKNRTHVTAERFLKERIKWLEKSLKQMTQFDKVLPPNTRTNYLQHKEVARQLVIEKLKFWNRYYNLPYKRVAIRNTKSRWGSCSEAGNLNFSYRLIFLPESLVDYIVVHELCHLRHPHHQTAFWRMVAETIPDHAERRHKLKKIA